MRSDIPEFITAVLLTGHGGFEALNYGEDVPVPKAQSDEVLIRVGAADVNNTDINTRVGERVLVRSVNAINIESDLSDIELASFPCAGSTAGLKSNRQAGSGFSEYLTGQAPATLRVNVGRGNWRLVHDLKI